jgi:UDP-glucose 4-epimerase
MMKLCGIRRIVFSSTAAVYGDSAKQPIEEMDPLRPSNPYGDTKLAFERALQWYGNAYGIRSVSLRYFNAAGASLLNGERHDPETHLIPSVLNVAAGVTPFFQLFGEDYPTKDGTCVRDYIHVEDLADAHVAALRAMQSRQPPSGTYNLGGGAGYSVREVLDTAQLVTGRSIATQVSQRRPGDPAVLIASSDRIQRELGWTPRRQRLDEIIDSAWRWMHRRRAVAA